MPKNTPWNKDVVANNSSGTIGTGTYDGIDIPINFSESPFIPGDYPIGYTLFPYNRAGTLQLENSSLNWNVFLYYYQKKMFNTLSLLLYIIIIIYNYFIK